MSDFVFLSYVSFLSIERIWETFFLWNIKPGRVFDKWSLPALSMAYSLVIISCIVEFFSIDRTFSVLFSVIGGILLTLGIFGRIISAKSLGIYHSPQVEIRENQPIVIKGPYCYIRHPYYLSVLSEVCGIPLCGNTFFSGFLVIFLFVPLLYLRLIREENYMDLYLGADFRFYKLKTPRFLPKTIYERMFRKWE